MPRAAAGETDGFVLVAVLWIVLLVAGLSTLFVRVIGDSARSNAAHIRSAAAEAAADGAIRLIAFRLATAPELPENGHAIPTNGAWWSCRLFDRFDARISVQDQDGLVDLNVALLSLLEPPLRTALSGSRTQAFLGEIARRRGADGESDLREPRSDIEVEMHAAGFSTTDELFGALDVDSTDADQAIRLFTTYSRSDGIDPAAAPRELLAILQRGAEDFPQALARPSRRRFFSVTVDAGNRSTGRSVRRAAVELIRSPEKPFKILEWGTASGSPIDVKSRGGQADGSLASASNEGVRSCLPQTDPR